MTTKPRTRLVPVRIGTTTVPTPIGLRVLDSTPQPVKPRRDRYGRFITLRTEARHEQD